MRNLIFVAFTYTLLFFNSALAQVTLIWETDTIFKGPESVAYDKDNQCLYVSNYNRSPKDGSGYNEDYISKLNLRGEVLVEKFITNLTAPTGICLNNGKLYITERTGIVQFDTKSNKVETRYWISKSGFLNDVTVDLDGTIYVTVSNDSLIYRIKNSKVEKWLYSKEIDKPNGILVDGKNLIVAVNSDSCLKSINISDKTIKTLVTFRTGILDGIKKYGDSYLVSHFEGNIYLVNNGEYTEILNTRDKKIYCADFEYIDSLKLFVIPALKNKKVFGYKYNFDKKN